jgi:hypothetical protein
MKNNSCPFPFSRVNKNNKKITNSKKRSEKIKFMPPSPFKSKNK